MPVAIFSPINNLRIFELVPFKSRGPKRKLSPEDELLLSLVRLRLGLLHILTKPIILLFQLVLSMT